MRFFENINSTLRAFLIILAIVAVVMIFQLYATLVVVGALVQIAFLLAIAFFLFLLWRERRSDIEVWSARSRFAFYGAVAVIVANIALYLAPAPVGFRDGHPSGLVLVAWLVVFPLCGYAIWRVWRDERTYR